MYSGLCIKLDLTMSECNYVICKNIKQDSMTSTYHTFINRLLEIILEIIHKNTK